MRMPHLLFDLPCSLVTLFFFFFFFFPQEAGRGGGCGCGCDCFLGELVKYAKKRVGMNVGMLYKFNEKGRKTKKQICTFVQRRQSLRERELIGLYWDNENQRIILT